MEADDTTAEHAHKGAEHAMVHGSRDKKIEKQLTHDDEISKSLRDAAKALAMGPAAVLLGRPESGRRRVPPS